MGVAAAQVNNFRFTQKEFACAAVCSNSAASEHAHKLLNDFARDFGFEPARTAALELNNAKNLAAMFANASLNYTQAENGQKAPTTMTVVSSNNIEGGRSA